MSKYTKIEGGWLAVTPQYKGIRVLGRAGTWKAVTPHGATGVGVTREDAIEAALAPRRTKADPVDVAADVGLTPELEEVEIDGRGRFGHIVATVGYALIGLAVLPIAVVAWLAKKGKQSL